MSHHSIKIGKGKIKMVYFLTFLAGMGFAALIDFTIQVIKRYRFRASLDIENDVPFAIDPDTTQVGKKQMAALADSLGI